MFTTTTTNTSMTKNHPRPRIMLTSKYKNRGDILSATALFLFAIVPLLPRTTTCLPRLVKRICWLPSPPHYSRNGYGGMYRQDRSQDLSARYTWDRERETDILVREFTGQFLLQQYRTVVQPIIESFLKLVVFGHSKILITCSGFYYHSVDTF